MQGLRGVPRDFKVVAIVTSVCIPAVPIVQKALYYFSLADEEKNAAAQGFMGKVVMCVCVCVCACYICNVHT